MELIENKNKISLEEEMYGHLPYWDLFSQHQGDYLNESDWLKIVSKIEEGLINKVKKKFEEKEASNFCSCYEGDLYDKYKEAVEKFLEDF